MATAQATTSRFDEPIGGASELFVRFDGRVIAGVQHADAPITADILCTSVWGQGVGAEIMGRGKFGPHPRMERNRPSGHR